jgi:hypothetical protein
LVGKVGAEMEGVQYSETADEDQPKGVKPTLMRACQGLFLHENRTPDEAAADNFPTGEHPRNRDGKRLQGDISSISREDLRAYSAWKTTSKSNRLTVVKMMS